MVSSEEAYPSSQSPARLSVGPSGGYSYPQSSPQGSYSDPNRGHGHPRGSSQESSSDPSTGYGYSQNIPQNPPSDPSRGYNYPHGYARQLSNPNGGQFPPPLPQSATPWTVSSTNGPQTPSASTGKSRPKPPLPNRKPDSLRRWGVDQARQIQDGAEDISFT